MHLLRIAVFFFALEKLLHASNTERLRFEQTFDVFACIDQTLSANDAFLVDQNRVGKLCDPELRPQLLRYDIVTAIDLMSGYERIVIELVTVAREGQLHVVASRDTSNDGLKFSADRAARRDEEDQLRIISMQKGPDILSVFRRLSIAASEIEKVAKFAHDDHLGYITSCPTNCGTALRASVHICLPNLAKKENKGQFDAIAEKYYV